MNDWQKMVSVSHPRCRSARLRLFFRHGLPDVSNVWSKPICPSRNTAVLSDVVRVLAKLLDVSMTAGSVANLETTLCQCWHQPGYV